MHAINAALVCRGFWSQCCLGICSRNCPLANLGWLLWQGDVTTTAFLLLTAFNSTEGKQCRLNSLICQAAQQRHKAAVSLSARLCCSFPFFFCLHTPTKRQKIMGIDILCGLPQFHCQEKWKQIEPDCKKKKKKNGWRKNKGCIVPFRDDGEENLPECSLQSRVPRLYTRITSCPVLCWLFHLQTGGHKGDIVWPLQEFITPTPLPWIGNEVPRKKKRKKKRWN